MEIYKLLLYFFHYPLALLSAFKSLINSVCIANITTTVKLESLSISKY